MVSGMGQILAINDLYIRIPARTTYSSWSPCNPDFCRWGCRTSLAWNTFFTDTMAAGATINPIPTAVSYSFCRASFSVITRGSSDRLLIIMLNIILGNISSGLPFVRHSFRLRVPVINCIVWRIVPIRPANNLSQTKLILTRLIYANATIRIFLSTQDACGVFRWPQTPGDCPLLDWMQPA